eukprot:GGOE01037002.1.p1 GENE.GGOE01037002.1~~GGOE01037002.1.p1  ORF type:complete len:425 (+),score=54.84 GGOE01037002.1:46-1275(+)
MFDTFPSCSTPPASGAPSLPPSRSFVLTAADDEQRTSTSPYPSPMSGPRWCAAIWADEKDPPTERLPRSCTALRWASPPLRLLGGRPAPQHPDQAGHGQRPQPAQRLNTVWAVERVYAPLHASKDKPSVPLTKPLRRARAAAANAPLPTTKQPSPATHHARCRGPAPDPPAAAAQPPPRGARGATSSRKKAAHEVVANYKLYYAPVAKASEGRCQKHKDHCCELETVEARVQRIHSRPPLKCFREFMRHMEERDRQDTQKPHSSLEPNAVWSGSRVWARRMQGKSVAPSEVEPQPHRQKTLENDCPAKMHSEDPFGTARLQAAEELPSPLQQAPNAASDNDSDEDDEGKDGSGENRNDAALSRGRSSSSSSCSSSSSPSSSSSHSDSLSSGRGQSCTPSSPLSPVSTLP